MIPATSLADFTSGEPSRIISAAHAVRHCHDRVPLRALARHVARIRRATEGVPLGGGLRSNATYLAAALEKLVLATGDQCLCLVFPRDEMNNPWQIAKAEVVDVLREESYGITPSGERAMTIQCRTCGSIYDVEEETGYHYPWYRWSVRG